MYVGVYEFCVGVGDCVVVWVCCVDFFGSDWCLNLGVWVVLGDLVEVCLEFGDVL